MGLLEDLPAKIYAGFKGRLLTGIIRQRAVPTSGALNALGDPIELAAVDTSMQGFTEDYSDDFMAKAGIPTTDLKVNIFAKSCPDVKPGKDDIVRFTQGGVDSWYQIRKVKTDPAKALWTCQSFQIPEPA